MIECIEGIWWACIPSAEYTYNSPMLGPFETREEAIEAMDLAWKERNQ
jgi:hypothetical protein